MQLPTSYCLIDLETTGLSANVDDAIEVAVIKVVDNKITETYESFIFTDIMIPEFIKTLTGITQDDVDNAPKPQVVWNDVKQLIGDDIIVAHNANFDINFMYDEMVENGIEPISNDFVDTLRLSRIAFKDFKNHKFKTLIKELGIEHNQLHRALEDVKCTFQVYKNIQESISDDDLIIRRKRKSISPSDLERQEHVDNDYIKDNVFVFTGTLELGTRTDAWQIVINHGGEVGKGVTKKTNYLVMGEYDYFSGVKDNMSSKHKKALEYKEQGQNIHVIPEDVFVDMLTSIN